MTMETAVCSCFALFALLIIAVLAVRTLRNLIKPSPELIMEEHAAARKEARLTLEMVEDGWPVPRWQVRRAFEILAWIRDHPDRRLPEHLRCSWSEYEKRLRKERSELFDKGNMMGWERIGEEFEPWYW